MKKYTMCMIAAAVLLFSSCGQKENTYDSNNPQASIEQMTKDMSAGDKVELQLAIQKIIMKEIGKSDKPFAAALQLAKNPEKAVEYTRCLDGMTAQEIIAMAGSGQELGKAINEMEKEIDKAADELDKVFDDMEKDLDKAFDELERELDNL